MTPPGIEPETIRLVVQCLNRLSHRKVRNWTYLNYISVQHLMVAFLITRLHCHTLFTSRFTAILLSHLQRVSSFKTVDQISLCVSRFSHACCHKFWGPAPILYSRIRFIRCYYSFCSCFKKPYKTHPISYQHLLHCSINSVFYEVYSSVTSPYFTIWKSVF